MEMEEEEIGKKKKKRERITGREFFQEAKEDESGIRTVLLVFPLPQAPLQLSMAPLLILFF